VKPYPKRFTVGYLGACGADKGLVYLLQAWKKLGYADSTLLLAGSQYEGMMGLAKQHGGGNIHILGFVDHISEFFNQTSCYVQPSATEGFGIEVLEAFAYGRYPLVSHGAGAVDILRSYHPNTNDQDNGSFPAGDVAKLCELIKYLKEAHGDYVVKPGFEQDQDTLQKELRDHARKYSWDKIEDQYILAWGF
jgi:glycosyltransferase involved in cell wall biosynthesis